MGFAYIAVIYIFYEYPFSKVSILMLFKQILKLLGGFAYIALVFNF